MKCQARKALYRKALYPVMVPSPASDKYQVSALPLSPTPTYKQAVTIIKRPSFTAQLSSLLRALPGSSLLPSCLRSQVGLRSPTRPASCSNQQDPGIPTACFSQSAARTSELWESQLVWKGGSDNSRVRPAPATCPLALC